MTRRELLQSMGIMALGRHAAYAGGFGMQATNPDVAYGSTTIPVGIRSRMVAGVNGITMHALEAGFETPNRPAVLLVHGFPELGYSWRHVMLPLAKAGFHVIAPDQRGYGRSGGTDVKFEDDLAPFSTLNRVRDMMALINALGHRSVSLVVGHDFGSPVAGWCALTRPDVFRAVVMMSAPFGGPAQLPFNTASAFARENFGELRRDGPANAGPNLDDELAKLAPPRKHYQTYYTTREANENMWHPPQGVHSFLRAYYHMKSADWTANKPAPLASNSAAEMAKLPRYYVMDLNKGMAEQVAGDMPTAAQIAQCKWLSDEELKGYSGEYGRTGFQGGLQSYRVGRVPRLSAELQLFAGRTIDVPSLFLSGKSDWGVYQRAGSLDAMQRSCTKFEGVELVDGAGHWVQQERAAQVADRLVAFANAHKQAAQGVVMEAMPVGGMVAAQGGAVIERMNPAGLSTPTGYSHIVSTRGGRTIYISGQVAFDAQGQIVGKGDLAAQTRQVFANLEIALKAAGATFANVVKTNYYVRDASQVAVVREVRGKYFTSELPASTFVEVSRLANPDFLIEIEVIAVV